MKVVSNLIVSFVFIVLIGCKHAQSPEVLGANDSIITNKQEDLDPSRVNNPDSSIENCVITNEEQKLRGELFPFEFKDFSVDKIRNYFSKDITIDSTTYNNEGTRFTIYTFKDATSAISFFVKPKEEVSWFYLEESRIEDNIINFKNGVRIGMKRDDVNNALGLKLNDCDTLHFQEGDLFTYYDFIFKNDTLVKIHIIPEE